MSNTESAPPSVQTIPADVETPPPPVQAIPADVADAAAKDLKPYTPRQLVDDPRAPWIYLPSNREPTQEVIDTWFESLVNVARVEACAGKKAKSLHSAFPVAFTKTNGRFKSPFPKQYVVIIALGHLHGKNGLTLNAEIPVLASGQDVILDGENDLDFAEGGGGIALFLLFDLVETE
ncbi:MAG: hypothetical protein Q9163_003780 [Psora crenata]